MHAFAPPVLARGRLAALCLALAGLLASCGGGDSSPPEAADPNQLSFDELVIPAGTERALTAERVTIRSRFDVKGTLALSLPAGSTADRVIVELPPGAEIEGTIALRQPARVAAASSTVDQRKQTLAAGVGPAAFVPRLVPSLVFHGIAGVPLIVYSTARFQTPAGDDAPGEVLADLSRLGANGSYEAATGGNGGDIHFSSTGVVVFRFPIGTPPGSWFRPFAPGNGGKGADLVLKDDGWSDAGITRMRAFAGAGGGSGRVLVDAAELRLEGDRIGDTFAIRTEDGTGVGGAGGRLSWDVVRPDLTSLEKIELLGGLGGGGLGQGGPGGVARFAAGKPLTPARAPRPVSVVVLGGTGGVGGEDYQPRPLIELPKTRTPKEPVVWAFGGSGGSVSVIAHTGWAGTATHPDGHEPGPLEVRLGWGGDVATGPLFVGQAGNGVGTDAELIRGGDGGAGYASCDPALAAGGAGGRSGHLTVRAGIGGSGPIGGDAGVLLYDNVQPGLPGKGGKGLTGGAAGVPGDPDRPPVDPPFGTDVRDHPGLRLEGVTGGESRDGQRTASSRVQGAFVPPAQTPGDTCGATPPPATGVIPLPAATYRSRSWYSNESTLVNEFAWSIPDGCTYLTGTGQALLSAGIPPCVTVHEVTRVQDFSSPTGYTETITDRTVASHYGQHFPDRAVKFLFRQPFCSVDGNLILPGSGGFTERVVSYDVHGDPVPSGVAFVDEHSAGSAPIYPVEIERTKNLCCAPISPYPNGRPGGYLLRSLVDGVCVPPPTNR